MYFIFEKINELNWIELIGIVIWTTFVHMGYKRLSNHDQGGIQIRT